MLGGAGGPRDRTPPLLRRCCCCCCCCSCLGAGHGKGVTLAGGHGADTGGYGTTCCPGRRGGSEVKRETEKERKGMGEPLRGTQRERKGERRSHTNTHTPRAKGEHWTGTVTHTRIRDLPRLALHLRHNVRHLHPSNAGSPEVALRTSPSPGPPAPPRMSPADEGWATTTKGNKRQTATRMAWRESTGKVCDNMASL